MKKLFTVLFMSFMLLAQLKAQDLATDYVVIDSSAQNLQQLKALYLEQAHTFFNDNTKPAPYIIPRIIEGTYPNLHLFVAAQPGSINFFMIAITAANAQDYIADFLMWKNHITSTVVIHNSEVFTGTAGIALKAKLEELTGLTFIAQ